MSCTTFSLSRCYTEQLLTAIRNADYMRFDWLTISLRVVLKVVPCNIGFTSIWGELYTSKVFRPLYVLIIFHWSGARWLLTCMYESHCIKQRFSKQYLIPEIKNKRCLNTRLRFWYIFSLFTNIEVTYVDFGRFLVVGFYNMNDMNDDIKKYLKNFFLERIFHKTCEEMQHRLFTFGL